MLIVNLTLGIEAEPERIELELALHPDYGNDAALASQILGLALTAEWPVLVDADGVLLRLPTGSVRAFAVRDSV